MTTPASAAQEALDLLAQTEHGGLCGCGYRESLHKVSGQGGAYCELAKARHLLRLVEENQQLLDSIDMFHKNVHTDEGVTSEPETEVAGGSLPNTPNKAEVEAQEPAQQVSPWIPSIADDTKAIASLGIEQLRRRLQRAETKLRKAESAVPDLRAWAQHQQGCGWQDDDTFDRDKCTCGLDAARRGEQR